MAYGTEIALLVGAAAAIAGTAVTTVAAVRQSQQQAAIAKTEAEILDAEAQNKQVPQIMKSISFVAALHCHGQTISDLCGLGRGPLLGEPPALTLDTVRQAEPEAQNIKRTGQVGASASEFAARLQRWVAGRARGEIPWQAVGGGLKAIGQGSSALGGWMGRSQPPRRPYGYF